MTARALWLLPVTAAALCAPRPSLAAARAEGLVIRVEPAYFTWHLDGPYIQQQVPSVPDDVQPNLLNPTRNGFGLIFHLGYNIKGHATLGVDLSATGWNLGSTDLGGAGFAAFTAAWHPIEIFQGLADRSWDASIFFGAGYGVLGQVRAMDGLHLELGLRAEYFLTRWFSLGAALRVFPLLFHRYVLDWSGNAAVELPNRSGGSAIAPSITLALHAPLG